MRARPRWRCCPASPAWAPPGRPPRPSAPRPGWAQHVGAVAAGDCYLNSDAFGDRDEAVCLFSYAGTEPHALVLVVDYNSAGMLSDGWVTSQVDTLLERCRDGEERGSFRPVP